MPAPALLTDREQQQQHIFMPASAKAAPAQRHAHHCSICGAVRHTHTERHMHTHVHTHIYAHTHAHAHTHTNTNACAYSHRRTHTHTHEHAQIHACTHILTPKHTGTHTRTHTYTHTLTRTRAYACTRCAHDGLRLFFSVASDAPSLVFLALSRPRSQPFIFLVYNVGSCVLCSSRAAE